MAEIVSLHTKDEVEKFARQNPFLHLYTIGDLDDFFWPYTVWFGLREQGRLRQLVLLYFGQPLPTLLALPEQPTSQMRDLLQGLLSVLPRRFYAHLGETLAEVFAEHYHIRAHGTFWKMGLLDRRRLAQMDGSEAVALSVADAADLQELYRESYPGNWFVARMLETGYYFGVRRNSSLVSVAGVHVFSPLYKAAALGNITTRPTVRGQGLATVTTARLCQELLRAGIEDIGLNVKADNQSAVACYEKIGFAKIATYGEYSLEQKV